MIRLESRSLNKTEHKIKSSRYFFVDNQNYRQTSFCYEEDNFDGNHAGSRHNPEDTGPNDQLDANTHRNNRYGYDEQSVEYQYKLRNVPDATPGNG